MKFAKTRTLNKLLYWPACFISAGMNFWLFFFFGMNLISSLIWGAIGLLIDVYKILKVRQYENAKKAKRKKIIAMAAWAWGLTFFSAGISCLFGVMEIQKKVNQENPQLIQKQNLENKIEINKHIIKDLKNNTYIEDAKIYESQLTELSGWTAQSYRNSARDLRNKHEAAQKKLNELTETNIYLASQIALIDTTSTLGPFEFFAKTIGARTDHVLTAFLFFVVIVLENIIKSGSIETAAPAKPAAKKKRLKKKKDDQLRLIG